MKLIEDEDENEEEDDSWRASFRFCACIVTMNDLTWERRHPCWRVPQSVEWPAGMPALPGDS
jgi:hypothetical protein